MLKFPAGVAVTLIYLPMCMAHVLKRNYCFESQIENVILPLKYMYVADGLVLPQRPLVYIP